MKYLIEPICKINEAIKAVLPPVPLLHGIVQPFTKDGELLQYDLDMNYAGLWDNYNTVVYHKALGVEAEITQRIGTKLRYRLNNTIRLYCVSDFIETLDNLFFVLSEQSNVVIQSVSTDKVSIIQSETGKQDNMDIQKHVFTIDYLLITHSPICDPCKNQ